MKPIKGKIGEPKKIGIHHPKPPGVYPGVKQMKPIKGKIGKPKKIGIHKEEVEQVDELKKSTLASYIGKAAGNVAVTSRLGTEFRRHAKTARNKQKSNTLNDIARDYLRNADKRRIGIKKAANKLAKEEFEQTSMSSVIEKYGMKKMKKEGIAPEAYADNSFGVGIPMEYDENNNLVEKDKKSKMWQIKKGY